MAFAYSFSIRAATALRRPISSEKSKATTRSRRSTVEVTEGRNRLTVQGFSLLIEDGDGQVWRRTFAFQGYRVRLVNKLPAEKPNPDSLTNDVDTSLLGKAAQAPQEVRSFMQRMKDKAKHWFSK